MEKQNGVHCPTKLVGPTRQTPHLHQQQQTPADFHQVSNNNNNNEQTANGNSNGVDRHSQIEQIVESAVREDARQMISGILEQVANLTWTEKLLLYLKLPTESSNNVDPLRHPLNPLGSRSEINQTIMWIKTHLEEDPELSLPKQDVYEEYLSYCTCNKMKPLSTADFGKVMKQVYPRVRPRRLGTRGNSRYCYAGLRKRLKLEAPNLPDVSSNATCCASNDLMSAAWSVVKEWAEALLGTQFASLQALAKHLVDKVSVNTNTVAACLVASSSGERNNNNTNSKHRETQMQLQRKLQQKEAKRKLQVSGGSQQTLKRAKSNQVCDKTADLTTLPERKQIQVEDNEQNNSEFVFCDNSLTNKMLVANAAGAKLPIPRLVSTKTQQITTATTTSTGTTTTTTTKKEKTIKYKTIQPKPAKCDKDVKGTLSDRSQLNKRQQQQQTRFGGNVEKDALDDYLIGGNNSQEQEEELMQYFNTDNNAPQHQHQQQQPPPQQPQQQGENKISQLRILLQQNYKTKLPGGVNLQARRRVSFETHQDSVPPSPNTRRKNFSFTPISPGPQSPNTASPFVSPRNTPVPKTRRLQTVESAPPSPMHKNQPKTYFANYANNFFPEPTSTAMFRSQSVPLSQQQFDLDTSQTTAAQEFAEFDTTLTEAGLNTENFNKILNILDNSQNNQQLSAAVETDMLSSMVDLQQNVFQFEEGFVPPSSDETVFSEVILPNVRNLSRSQSTDVPKFAIQPPSRSVPSTPLPSLNLNYINNNTEITSRSYPSTPTDTILRYGQQQQSASTQDFLLNGQPIKFFGGVDDMIYNSSPQQQSQQQQLQQQDNKLVDSSTCSSYQNCNYGYSDYVPSNGHSNV